ncbi:lipocalin family protein [Flavobacterium sp. 5]|uniref:lipocalin family protein n=1 Tax=Flavobacterium sp. 5 TaxID=2035199 RepID=UPI000C2C2FAD|nr:lipocalin family protein [Flavobacterium sp. 5]PKB16233.1 lipocalin-like protein [Flavobacterium sp. 5]
MKKLTVLFLSLVALVSVVSCNKDDDNNSSTDASIEGKWQLTQQGDSDKTLAPAVNEGGCATESLEIKTGGTFTVTWFEYFEQKCTQDNGAGTWEKKDNVLTIKEDGETTVLQILEISNTSLKLKGSDEDGEYVNVYTRK